MVSNAIICYHFDGGNRMTPARNQSKASCAQNGNPLRENKRLAKLRFGCGLLPELAKSLKRLSEDFGFSLSDGEIQLLNNSWYVTHTGLLRLARRRKCRGIHVEAVDSLCDSALGRYG